MRTRITPNTDTFNAVVVLRYCFGPQSKIGHYTMSEIFSKTHFLRSKWSWFLIEVQLFEREGLFSENI